MSPVTLDDISSLKSALHCLDICMYCARKGWLRRQDVLNTRKVDEIEKFFATPKAKR